MRPIPLSHMRVIREEALKVLLNPAKFTESQDIGLCFHIRKAYKQRLKDTHPECLIEVNDHYFIQKGDLAGTPLVYGIVSAYQEHIYGEHYTGYLGGRGEWNDKRYALCLWLATAPYAEIERVVGTKFVGAELDPYFI